MECRLLRRDLLIFIAASLLPGKAYPASPEAEPAAGSGRQASWTNRYAIAAAAAGTVCGLIAVIPLGIWMNLWHQRRLQQQRALLGDELHDELGPMIYYSRMMVTAEMRVKPAPSPSLTELGAQLEQLGETVRDLSRALRHEGATTVEALEGFLSMQLSRWTQAESGTGYVVHGTVPQVTLSLFQYMQLLRVLQELMLNSCRHAPGKTVHLMFESQRRRRLRIRYWDEGTGLNPCNSSGNGTISTRDRIRRIGGTLQVNNRFPEGYDVTITLPL